MGLRKRVDAILLRLKSGLDEPPTISWFCGCFLACGLSCDGLKMGSPSTGLERVEAVEAE